MASWAEWYVAFDATWKRERDRTLADWTYVLSLPKLPASASGTKESEAGNGKA